MPKNMIIKHANPNQMDILIDWAAREGWNPGLNDAHNYYLCDPKGFLIGEVADQPIATISAVKYANNFGFVGFYIVKKEFRGQGYGLQIWNAAMETLAGFNIGLDGVVDQQSNYRKSGFDLVYRNIRFAGVTKNLGKPEDNIVKAMSLDIQQLEAYDHRFFPSKRSDFFRSWITQPSSLALTWVEDDQIKGLGVLRECHEGFKVGPLYAESVEIAESIFVALSSGVEAGKPVFLDVPETNHDGVMLAEKLGMTVSFETARMYIGSAPVIPTDNLFGVTSFEVG